MGFRKLYVIGNGFDLWHGIPSSYWHFKNFVKERDRHVFEDVESYVPAGDDWCDLEAGLAEVEVEDIVDQLGHFMGSYGADDWSDSGHHDFQYEVEELVGRLSTKLRIRFAEWIRTLPIPTPRGATKMLSHVDTNAAFLTFNYTSTLQSLYGVGSDRVLHIHGCANVPTDALVLGHAWSPQNRKSLADRRNPEDVDTRLMEAYSILDDYFSSTFKPSAQIIAARRPFFSALGAVDEVHVLGHSLASVDWPYFEALLKDERLRSASWYVACRSETEFPEKHEILKSLGIKSESIKPIFWDKI